MPQDTKSILSLYRLWCTTAIVLDMSHEDINQNAKIALMKEISLSIWSNIELFDQFEPVDRSICVLFLIDQMKKILHKVIWMIGKGDVFVIFFHKLDQIFSCHLSHLYTIYLTSSFSRCSKLSIRILNNLSAWVIVCTPRYRYRISMMLRQSSYLLVCYMKLAMALTSSTVIFSR